MLKKQEARDLHAAVNRAEATSTPSPYCTKSDIQEHFGDLRRIIDRETVVTRGDEDQTPLPLTARESEVFHLLARGRTNAEIADKLEISVKTVDTHRGHVMKKLELGGNAALVVWAIAHGYMNPKEVV